MAMRKKADKEKPLKWTARQKARFRMKLKNMTPRQEAQVLARLIKEIDVAQLEAQCRELVSLKKQGKLIPAERVLRDLYKKEPKRKKKSA